MSAGRFAPRSARDRTSATEAELISRLRTLPKPIPDAQFRSDLRSQLVAITARIVTESATPASAGSTARSTVGSGSTAGSTLGSGSTASAGSSGRRSRPRAGVLRALRRPVLAFAGASAVLVLLLGMAVWMSGGSLPGQSLYGVKRASENAQLSMARSDTDKGRAYLQLAGSRLHEAADLLKKPAAAAAGGNIDGGRISAHTASLVIDTLLSADTDSRSGMQLLGGAAVAQLSKEPLASVSNWLPGQRALVIGVRDRIPLGSLHNRAQASLELLDKIAARTTQLTSRMGCPCLSRARSDELGPLPCNACGPVASLPPGGSGGLPVPLPGVGKPGTSTTLPSLSLPALGGSGGSSSGHAAGVRPAPPTSIVAPGQGKPAGSMPTTVPHAALSKSALLNSPLPGGGELQPGPVLVGPVLVGPGGLSPTLPGGSAAIGTPGAVSLPAVAPPAVTPPAVTRP